MHKPLHKQASMLQMIHHVLLIKLPFSLFVYNPQITTLLIDSENGPTIMFHPCISDLDSVCNLKKDNNYQNAQLFP